MADDDRSSNPGTEPFVPDFSDASDAEDTGTHSWVPDFSDDDDTGSQPAAEKPESTPEAEASSADKIRATYGVLETALYTDDMPRAQAFYEDVLGLQPIFTSCVRTVASRPRRRWHKARS